MKKNVVAIEFGTSKIVTLVAEHNSNRRCDVIAAGVQEYDGFMNKNWNNPAALDEAIQASIEEAAHQCNRKIHEVNIGVPGQFTSVYATEAAVELKGTDPVVKAADVKRVFQQANANLQMLPGIVVHTAPAWFTVDSGKKTLEPVGLKGRNLRGMISYSVADKFFIDDLNSRLQNMKYTVNGFYSTLAGETMLYIPEAERDHTAVMIDVGYLNTNVVIVEGDAMLFNRTIEFGGGHMTAALAEKLDITFESAEHIKRDFTYNLSEANPETFTAADANNGAKEVKREAVAAVLESCVADLAEEIQKAIADSGSRLGDWSNYFIAGGGLCMNKGGKDYLANKLNHAIKDVPKRSVKLFEANYCSAFGLVDLVINIQEGQQQAGGGSGSRIKDFINRLMNG